MLFRDLTVVFLHLDRILTVALVYEELPVAHLANESFHWHHHNVRSESRGEGALFEQTLFASTTPTKLTINGLRFGEEIPKCMWV